MMARFTSSRGDAAASPIFPLCPLAAFPSLSFALSPPRVIGLGALATYCNHIGPFCLDMRATACDPPGLRRRLLFRLAPKARGQ